MDDKIECDLWEEKPEDYQNECIRRIWVDRAVEVQAWQWVSTSCDSPYCVRVEHLEINSPVQLKYPKNVCVYCGSSGYTRDHLVPESWSGPTERRHVLTVWACLQCNSFISDHPATSITERRAIAHQRIAKKYKKVLQYREYSEEELEEFGDALRSAIIQGIEHKRILEERLRFPDSYEFDLRALEKSGYPDPWASGLL